MYDELVTRLRKRAINLKEKFSRNAELLSELMEAADAIDELDTLLDGVSADKEALCETIEMLKKQVFDMCSLIGEYSEKTRWIPVTERLPEKRKWVLCRCAANIIEVLRWENNEWYHDPMHVYYPSFVTHWMPLPEPPNEEATT